MNYDSWREYEQQRFLTSSLMTWMFDNYSTDPAQRKEIYYSPMNASIDQLKVYLLL